MIVFTRKTGETIVIGKAGDKLTEPIVIHAVRVPRKCRIGIEAEREINIRRGEIESNQEEGN